MGQGPWGEETEYTEAMSEQLPSQRKTFIGELQSCFYRPGNCSVLSDLRNVCIDFLIAEIFRNIADNTVIRCIIQ